MADYRDRIGKSSRNDQMQTGQTINTEGDKIVIDPNSMLNRAVGVAIGTVVGIGVSRLIKND